MAGLSLSLGMSLGAGGVPIGPDLLDGVEPSLYLDFTQDVFAARELDGQDYLLDGVEPALLLDFANDTHGDRQLNGRDYLLDGAEPTLLTDFANQTYGA